MKIAADTYLLICGSLPMPKKTDLTGWECEKATQKQKDAIGKFGVAHTHIKYKGQASLVLDMIFSRKKRGLCSPKQIEILLRNGYTSADIAPMTVQEAGEIITDIFKGDAYEEPDDEE